MRYIGAKTELLDEIKGFLAAKGLLNSNKKEVLTFCDAFSGTGAVGEYLKTDFRIIANDIQFYSYVMTRAKLNPPDMCFSKLGLDPFEYFNSGDCKLKGFVYNNYSTGGSERMYFSEENALRIDFIRAKIDEWHESEKINDDEYYYLIACLIESVSKVANVAGVYGSYLKTWDPRAIKWMPYIKVELKNENPGLYEAEVHNERIESLINDVGGDILYLDPPYTQNQYSVQYHLLETIAKNDRPQISGKGGSRDTSATSSAFSRKGDVETIFEKIIAKAKFKHIILSYNSDGLMTPSYMENIMKRYGKPETFDSKKVRYKQYKNHQTKDDDKHCEYLFYIEKDEKKNANYASPLNYQGGKYDLVDFIKANMPDERINRFIDLFGGGYNVGINIEANQHVYNDINFRVVELMECFKNTPTNEIVSYVIRTRNRYKLEPGGKEAYLRLRDKYNSTPIEKRDPKMLYLLILYGFNQMIRFNSSYDYNNPVGPAGFNDKMLDKLVSFCRKLKEQNVVFLSRDFNVMDEYITNDSFVYCDPPYLITLGSYNDGKRGFNGWNKDDELKLYAKLDKINRRGIKFMMSNILEHNGRKNMLLSNWVKQNKYNVVEYKGKARKGRKEILILNYKKEDK